MIVMKGWCVVDPDPVVLFDYSQGRPTAAQVKEAGGVAVMRYLPFEGSHRKDLTVEEARELLAGGIGIGPISETVADRATSGYQGGVVDAEREQWTLNHFGMPSAAVWFTVDYDVVVPAQFETVKDYFRGIGTVLPLSRIKAYGERDVCRMLLDAGLVSGAWQTTAWSKGEWDDEFHMIQRLGVRKVGGVESDVNHWNIKAYPDLSEAGIYFGEKESDMQLTPENLKAIGQAAADAILFNTELQDANGSTGYNLNTTVVWSNKFDNEVPAIKAAIDALKDTILALGSGVTSDVVDAVDAAFARGVESIHTALQAQDPRENIIPERLRVVTEAAS